MKVRYWLNFSHWTLVSRDWFGVFLTLDKYLANVDIHCFGNGTHLYFWVSFHISHSYQHSFIFRNMALVSCFPISSHGIMFALIELCRKVLHLVWNRYPSKIVENHKSSMVNFSQIPVTNEVKIKQNFDLLSTLLISTSG